MDASESDDVADDPTPAAVLIPVLTDGSSTILVFTRRAPDLETHAGQMSFPGGRREPEDESMLDTALREAHEEIDLHPSAVTVGGQLDPITTVTGFSVTPFVGAVDDSPFRPDPTEVAEIVTIDRERLTDPTAYENERRAHPTRGDMTVHYFRVDGYTIWGATARILVQYLERTSSWTPPGEPKTT